MTRIAQAISTHMTDFRGKGRQACLARYQGLAEVTDAEDPLVRIKLHRRRPLPSRPTVITMGFDRPAWRRFGPPPVPPDRTRIWRASGVSADGERIDGRINRLTSCGCDTVRQQIILFAGRRSH